MEPAIAKSGLQTVNCRLQTDYTVARDFYYPQIATTDATVSTSLPDETRIRNSVVMKINVLLLCTILVYSCSKDDVTVQQRQPGEKQICDLGVERNVVKRVAERKRPNISIETEQPRPGGTILIDFDGHLVENTSWNVSGPLSCAPSGLTAAEQQQVVDRVKYHFSIYNVTVTTNEATYNITPATERQRIIVTSSYEWYGSGAGGTSFLNSFFWGDNTPAFVFDVLLEYSTLKIGEAIAHEAGHSVGLRHQVDCSGGVVVNQYSSGKIMGNSYTVAYGVWNVGPTVLNCAVYDEPQHLQNVFGLL